MNRSGEVEAEFTIPIEGLVHEAFGVARHSNGTMYIALTGSRGKAGSEDDFIAVARLGADNLPDPTFGVDGICEVSFAHDAILAMGVWGISMVLKEDGGVVVIARDKIAGDPLVAGLARFTADGKLDETFGQNGVFVHYLIRSKLIEQPVRSPDVAGNEWRNRMMESRSQVVSSSSWLYLFETRSLLGSPGPGVVARFLPNGIWDKDFGEGGLALVAPSDPAELAVILRSLTVLSDSAIAMCGNVIDAAGRSRGLIARYLKSGQPDESFGDKGFVFIDPPQAAPGVKVSLLFEGIAEGAASSIICVGHTLVYSSEYSDYGVIVHLDKAGAHMPSFNDGKPVEFSVSGHGDNFTCVAQQADNKIVAAGYAEILDVSPDQVEFLVARFNSDGTRDLSFAGRGWTTKAYKPGINYLRSMMLDNNLIVIAGTHDGLEIPVIVSFRT